MERRFLCGWLYQGQCCYASSLAALNWMTWWKRLTLLKQIRRMQTYATGTVGKARWLWKIWRRVRVRLQTFCHVRVRREKRLRVRLPCKHCSTFAITWRRHWVCKFADRGSTTRFTGNPMVTTPVSPPAASPALQPNSLPEQIVPELQRSTRSIRGKPPDRYGLVG